jgi:hypothetical protein
MCWGDCDLCVVLVVLYVLGWLCCMFWDGSAVCVVMVAQYVF